VISPWAGYDRNEWKKVKSLKVRNLVWIWVILSFLSAGCDTPKRRGKYTIGAASSRMASVFVSREAGKKRAGFVFTKRHATSSAPRLGEVVVPIHDNNRSAGWTWT